MYPIFSDAPLDFLTIEQYDIQKKDIIPDKTEKRYIMYSKKKDNTLGENLKKVREAAGLSQAKLGEMLSTGVRTISDYETGKSTPSLDYLRRFCELFKVPIASLVGFGHEKTGKHSSYLSFPDLNKEELEVIKLLRSLDDEDRKKALKVLDAFQSVKKASAKKAE